MGLEQIRRVHRVTAYFGVKVKAPCGKAPGLKYGIHGQSGFVVTKGKLIRIPAGNKVSPVGVHGTKEAQRGGGFQFMIEVVACQFRVVGLNIHPKVFVQVVGFKKERHRFHIIIVLMFGRLHGFGLHIKHAFEPLFTGIIPGHAQETAQVILFLLYVCVKETHVPFPASPEGIALTTQFNGGIYG